MISFGYRELPYSDEPEIVDIRQRFKHMYILGKPGTGKSSLLENMIQQDLDNNHSVIYIDPKGVSAEMLYYKNKDTKNVRYVDFNNPIKLNPLKKGGYSLDDVASEFSDIINVMINETASNVEMTARMHSLLHNLIKGVKSGDLHIKKFIDLFLNPNQLEFDNFSSNVSYFWKSVLSKKEYNDRYNKYILTMASIADRLQMFISDRRMDDFLDDNDFDLENFLEDGQSLMINISDGISESKRFLANLFVYSITSYTRLKVTQKPLFVYIDEFQVCASRAFADALRICRSKNIGFIMAHQDFGGINRELLEDILAISDNYIVFRVGYYESELLSNYLQTNSRELMNLSDYCAFLRSGKIITPFFTYKPILFNFIKEAPPNFINDNWI
jgi:DNA helicase HerA-like ATPase